MNIESLKNKFITELLESLKTDPSKEDLTAEDISIFEYADEFKDFIADECNIDASELSYNISDLMKLEIDDFGQFEYAETDENSSNEDANKNNFIASFLNLFLNDENIKNEIDADGDGKISDEEKTNFLNTIAAADGDEKSISLNDLMDSMEKVENKDFKIDTPKVEKEETEETTPTENVSSSGNSSGYSSGGSTISTGGNKTSSDENTSNIPDFSKMTTEEINTELDNAETNISDGKDKASAILGGTDPELAKMQEQVDEAYKNYQEELQTLDKDMAEELDKLVENVEEKEKARDEKLLEVAEQTIAVSDAETTYQECQDTTASLEETLDGLNGTLTSLQGALSGASEEEQASINAQIAEVQAQIATVESELTAAKEAEEKAKTDLDEAKEKLETLESEADELSEDVQTAKEEKTEYEKQIVEKYPEIQELQTAYNECKSNAEAFKAEELSTAMTFISENQDIKNAAKIELNARKNKEEQKEYDIENGLYNEEEGNRLVETAKEMLAKFGSTTGLCATGVSRTIQMAYGITMGGNGCDWDTNMEQLVDKGMFVEVTSNYPSSNDLSSLPAGAVVCWEATTGEGNGGARYGHVTVADGNGGEISDHYQPNIYTSIGGRSDQYRIFIPV